jgi:mRNA interferase MazF
MARRAAGGRSGVGAAKRFEIYSVRLDPVLGAEIGKTRPAVIVSPDEANDALRTVIVAPLTSVRRAWPTRVAVKVNRVAGDVALDQMRAVDKQRLAKRVGVLSSPEARALLDRLGAMFAA